jgi:hypothetical protein
MIVGAVPLRSLLCQLTGSPCEQAPRPAVFAHPQRVLPPLSALDPTPRTFDLALEGIGKFSFSVRAPSPTLVGIVQLSRIFKWATI